MPTKKRFLLLAYSLGAVALMMIPTARLAHAITLDVALAPDGTAAQSTAVFSADLASLGLTSLHSITLLDSNSGTGGSGGQFSGADLDAVFLRDSGGSQINPTSISFTAGTLRGGTGPTFGASSATTINDAVATLSLFDADDGVPDLSTVNGFLSLGDGGILVLYFDPDLAISAGLKLFLGEVNTAFGESLTVRVAQTPLPPALWMLLSAVICLCSVAFWRRARYRNSTSQAESA